jgi:hypothetical protein
LPSIQIPNIPPPPPPPVITTPDITIIIPTFPDFP